VFLTDVPAGANTSRRLRAAVVFVACAVIALTGCAAARQPTVSLSPEDTLKEAQRLLTDECLVNQGITPPRPGRPRPVPSEGRRLEQVLFGSGEAELSLRLPSGHVVQQHTDGCLAAAQRRLYGDQRAWFRASTTVNNLQSNAPTQVRAGYDELRARALTRARALLSDELTKETAP
jgi:hypothetical protein